MKRIYACLACLLLSLMTIAQTDRQPVIRKNIPLDSIRLSDPAILANAKTKMYYMTGTGGLLWKSKDLTLWEGPYHVAQTDSTSWMGPKPMIWAAELHAYKNKYYYFATFTNRAVKIDSVKGNVIERRASHILVSDKPDGPYVPMRDSIYLPANKPTLDGTFWVDTDGKPYMIYCYEWLQNWDGTIEKIELKPDLSGSIGEGRLLFRASSSPWSREKNKAGVELPNKVTDGPWLFKTATGRLGMLWTSWVYDVYTQGVAYSQSGTLNGPWVHEEKPVTPPNYGHGMLFKTLDGKWLMSVHSHKTVDGKTYRTPHLFEVDLSGDRLVVGKEYKPVSKGNEAGNTSSVTVTVNPGKTFQTIDNFAASDAWSCQFVGNWPDDKKNAIADWLFSMDTLQDGSPKGIGLSAWRFNFGAGSAQQGEVSGIKDEWRRAESFLDAANTYNWNRQQGQLWFLQAAKQRGVKNFIGFYNSPPVQYTRNGKAFATAKVCNIAGERYDDFADYIVTTLKGIKQKWGIDFNYISPVNEPQWDWSDGGQEGSPYYNTDISGAVRSINRSLQHNRLATKILLPEAGEYYYLYEDRDKPGKGSQVNAFFNKTSPDYIGNLPNVSKIVAAHSYFTSSPFEEAEKTRRQVHNSISRISGLKFWQSEYCILGDNDGEINGAGKDTGIIPALYVAKLIYNDLVNANATAWQWWLAISPYDYKDGLVYIDKHKTDGQYHSSKMMWALGNYSRFVRPGMKRAELRLSAPGIYASAYIDENKKHAVIVAINESKAGKNIHCAIEGNTIAQKADVFLTTAGKDLVKEIASLDNIILPSESVATIVVSY